jgi:uncharacterized protein (DUF58 family)
MNDYQDDGTRLSAQSMFALEQAGKSLSFFSRSQELGQYSEGPRATQFCGHGMIFDSLRPYQPGDDPRYLDWQAFARTGKAYSKVFVQERSEAVYSIYDASLSMQFGTRQCFKSVLAAKASALLSWEANARGDLVGGYCMQGQTHQRVTCQPGQTGVLAWIGVLAQQFEKKKQHHDATCWQYHLDVIMASIPKGSRLLLFSDFAHLNAQVVDKLKALSLGFRVCLFHVQDPLESMTKLPLAWVTDQEQNTLLLNQSIWQSYQEKRQQQATLLTQIAAMGVPLITLTTEKEVVSQLQNPQYTKHQEAASDVA